MALVTRSRDQDLPYRPGTNLFLWNLKRCIGSRAQASQTLMLECRESRCACSASLRATWTLFGSIGAKSDKSLAPSLNECLLQFVQKHCFIDFGKLLALFRHIEHINCLLAFGVDQGNLDVAIEARHYRGQQIQ
jgi:hypothetical protein